MSDVLVSVWCATYNHKNYIRDALEGFVRQKTNFRYEVIIHDDASTDGTQEIIEKYHQQYPNIFVPIYEKENVYSKGINSFNSVGISYVRGKYVALCEGDDFWIDEYKLQKQVDFLESHPDYSMCCHAGYYVDESGYKLPGAFKTFDSDCTVDTDALIKKWICPTASIVYNFGKYMDNRFPPLKNAPCGDYPKIINFSIYGKLYFFSSIWSAYRISNSSVSAKWRDNTQSCINKNKRFIGMLDQIDEITHFQYAESIDYMRARREYENCCMSRDIKSLKSKRYIPFIKENRLRYYYYVLLRFFPFLETINKKIRKNKKNYKKEKISYF